MNLKLAPPSSLPLVLLPKFIFVDGTQTLQGNDLNFVSEFVNYSQI
jgi:hypothetical protein